MKILIRDKVVDFEDDLDLNYAGEYVLWIEYKRLQQLVSNIASKKDLSKWEYAFNFKFNNGGYENIRETLEKTEGYDWVSNDNCMGTRTGFGTKDNLLIYVCSHAGPENRMDNEILSIPNRIKDLSDRFDILVVNEHPLRFPEIIYPSYLVLGCSEENNTFEKMCSSIESRIKKSYNKVIVMGDSKHAGIALSIAHKLHEHVTNAFILHGQTSYDWEESGWVTSYLSYLEKREKLFLKTGHLDDTMLNDFSGPAIFHLFKSYKFKKMGIDNRILSPFKYHNEYNITVDYFYNKKDLEYKPFLDWVMKNGTGDINFHEVKHESHNPHFIRPHVERKILPDYIKNLLKT